MTAARDGAAVGHTQPAGDHGPAAVQPAGRERELGTAEPAHAAAVVNPFTGRWVMEPKPQNVWGIPHAVWFALMGIGGALFINLVLFDIELGRFFGMSAAKMVSLVLIGIGGLILIADLGRPLRVLRALSNPRTSWISVGAIADFVFVVFGGLWMVADLEILGTQPLAGLPWAGSSPLGLVFQGIAVAAAFIVIIYPGLVLASSPSIPFWNTMVIPLQYLAYAFSSALAIALVYAAVAAVPDATLRTWATVQGGLLFLCLLLLVAHLLNARYTHTAARVSVQRLVGGNLRPAFFLGTLVVGLAVPAVLLLWALLSPSPAELGLVLALAGLLAIVGNWFSKFVVIRAGTYAPFM
jgi:formate-dependent nitrite reductase membrane component NrfD